MTVPVTTIDATGCHVPRFEDVRAAIRADYLGIYGQDVYVEEDSQDGQFLGIFAAAVNDTNAMALACYNAFSPATAQGTGLSSVVKINGIARNVASRSTVDVKVVGQAGTVLTNAAVSDGTNRWSLPVTVVIPLSGEITVTATCQALGAVTAAPGTVTGIFTPTRGWQSATNLAAATPGAPVEKDPALRVRQTRSTMLPSQTVLDGVIGIVTDIPGVTRLRAYDNDGAAPDANGIPAHALALVVDGGDAQALAEAIAARKGGGGTYGSTVVTVPMGVAQIPTDIRFFRPVEPPIRWHVALKALKGYTTDTEAQIAQALSDWTNALGIGNPLLLTRAYVPANLYGAAAGATFEIQNQGLTVARDSDAFAAADVPILFNEAASCTPTDVSFSYVP